MLKSNVREGEILSSHAAMESNRHNLDRATVDDFGREWQRFDQSSVSSAEVRRRFGPASIITAANVFAHIEAVLNIFPYGTQSGWS